MIATLSYALKRSNDQKFDGLIITGAPVEHLEFEEVDYWPELQDIMDWAETARVFDFLYLLGRAGWAVSPLWDPQSTRYQPRIFGVFPHDVLIKNEMLMRGFDDVFMAPHSRHTEIRREDIEQVSDLKILCQLGGGGCLYAWHLKMEGGFM